VHASLCEKNTKNSGCNVRASNPGEGAEREQKKCIDASYGVLYEQRKRKRKFTRAEKANKCTSKRDEKLASTRDSERRMKRWLKVSSSSMGVSRAATQKETQAQRARTQSAKVTVRESCKGAKHAKDTQNGGMCESPNKAKRACAMPQISERSETRTTTVNLRDLNRLAQLMTTEFRLEKL
jgi:hypothetical protein